VRQPSEAAGAAGLFRRSRVFAWPLLSAVALPERTSSAQSSSAPQNPSRLAAGAAAIGRPGLSTAGATAATVRLTPKSDPGPRHYRQQRGAKSRWRAGVTTRAYCCWSACELASHRISCTLGREKRPAVAQLELMFKLAAASRRSAPHPFHRPPLAVGEKGKRVQSLHAAE
jgi:hypothetical protein